MWTEYEVRCVGAKGTRMEAIAALRTITGAPVGEVSAKLGRASVDEPWVVFEGGPEAVSALFAAHGNALDLRLWPDDLGLVPRTPHVPFCDEPDFVHESTLAEARGW